MADAVDPTPAACDAWLAMCQRAQAGDPEALNRLATESRPKLLDIATNALPKREGGMEDASDIAQKGQVPFVVGG